MEPIDAGDIPLDEVVRELFSERGLSRLLGRYDTACFVLARSGLQRQFFQELIENIDTIDETTRDKIAFIVFHGNRSSYIPEDEYRYSYHLNGLSISQHRDSRPRPGRDHYVAFAPEFRRRIKTAPEDAPFRAIGRATDFAASLLMERFDVRETSLPCLVFVDSSKMDEPQIVRLSPKEPMESLYRDVLAPLSDELRLVDRLVHQRSEVSSSEWRYKNARETIAEFDTDLAKLTKQLQEVRTEIAGILAATPQPPIDALKSERADLEIVHRTYKAAKSFDERLALGRNGPYAANVIEMEQRFDALVAEKIRLETEEKSDDGEKRLHALSSSIGRLKSKLGSLSTRPASEAADRINRIDAELRRLEAHDPLRSQRRAESDLVRNLEYLQTRYENAQKTVDEYSEEAVVAGRKKAEQIEEQLRRHGFSAERVSADKLSAIEVATVLNKTGAIGFSNSSRKATRPTALSAPPQKMLLLFMHGLGGAREATWGKFPSLLTSDDEVAARYAVDFYTFPTQLFRLPFSARSPKIQVLADGLRTQIKYAGFERVSLVCHSLGGLVAKQYLIEELDANRELKVDHVAFIAVPNNGSDLAAAGALLSWRQHQLRQLQKDADIIEFSNKAWRRLDVRSKVQLKYIVGSQDRVVDRLSAEEYWGNPDVETVLGSGHIDIVKPNSTDDMVVKIVKHFLLS